MLVEKPQGPSVITLVHTIGRSNPLHCRYGLTYSPCGHFLNCRDKICATPNTSSGELLQGTRDFVPRVTCHLSFQEAGGSCSPVKGLAVISCRCRTSEPLETGGQMLLFHMPVHTGAGATGPLAEVHAATAPPAPR